MNPLLLLVAGAGAFFLLRRSGSRPRRNPQARQPNAKLCEKDQHQLEQAQRLSEEFHGNKNHVLELDHGERHLPKYVVELGAMPEMSYSPEDSKRAGNIWEHAAGDRGILRPKNKNKPVLAARPDTRRPIIVPMRSPVKFDEERGLVG